MASCLMRDAANKNTSLTAHSTATQQGEQECLYPRRLTMKNRVNSLQARPDKLVLLMSNRIESSYHVVHTVTVLSRVSTQVQRTVRTS